MSDKALNFDALRNVLNNNFGAVYLDNKELAIHGSNFYYGDIEGGFDEFKIFSNQERTGGCLHLIEGRDLVLIIDFDSIETV